MSKTCHIDLESFSEEDLKSSGVYRYAEHPSTEFYVLGYRFDAEKVVTLWMPFDGVPEVIITAVRARCLEKYWVLPNSVTGAGGYYKYDIRLLRQTAVPRDLHDHIVKGRDVNPAAPGGELRAHNAQFERVVLSGTAGKRVNFPRLTIEQFVCTAAKMAANGLPRALGDSADALGTHPKDETGRISMLQLAKPRKPTKADPSTRWTFQNAPEKYIEVLTYNVDDVLAECGVDDAVPDLTPYEQKVYQLDQLINQRGIRVDLPAIENVQALITEYKEFLAAACAKATGDELLGVEGFKPTQRDKIAEWVRANGYPQLMDMQAETVKEIIAGTVAPDHVKHVLRIYSTYNAKAVTKYNAIQDAVCADGRLRGMFLYHGANTGRWSSLIVQLQNLFRPVIDDPELAIEAFSSRSLEWIKALYDGVDSMKVFASCVRGMLIADDDKDLCFPDYAGIEARVNAWLFDEEWKLEAFRAYDAKTGPDLYKLAYSRAFQIPPEQVTKQQRQVGKVMELALGYEGGCGAFVTMVDTYGVNLAELTQAVLPILPEDVKAEAQRMWDEMPQHRAGLPWDQFIACDSLKRLWRRTHPKIKQGWKDLKAAAEQAVQFAGKAYSIPNGKIAFKVLEYRGRRWLNMRLPSGRTLKYYNPRWIPEESVKRKDEWGNEYTEIIPGELRYWGTDTHTRRWMEVSSYGGKWDENGDQGISACILRVAMFALEENGYPLIGSVHDEPITEPKKGYGSMEHVQQLICAPIKWAPGLPLAIDGHRGPRYRK